MGNSRQQAADSRQWAALTIRCLLPAARCLLFFVSTCRAEELYERINRRVEEMFAAGLADEVRQLRAWSGR